VLLPWLVFTIEDLEQFKVTGLRIVFICGMVIRWHTKIINKYTDLIVGSFGKV